LQSIDGVIEIHDLHVWNPSAENIALAAHITVQDQMLSKVDNLAQKVRDILLRDFKIDHPILQFESSTCTDADLLCHIINNGHKDHNHDEAGNE
jgi:cobalt-zinc-cadmium efflux system protein